MINRSPATIALLLGAAALALLLGALGFQYLDRLPPCEMCMWQRYPHIAAAAFGIGGFLLMRARLVPQSALRICAAAAICAIALSGAIGVYHAGVEWHWWKGPQSCTGPVFQYTGGPLDLDAPVVACDRAAWRLLGLSLAGYNALLSLGIAAVGLYFLVRDNR
jgi:disulfide bond formation protein DsbB